jgi:hypothetical protein
MPSKGRVLIVFAKAPEPGKVKTRLAHELGDLEAARIYRALGRRVVDRVRGGPYRTIVYFDPPEARDDVVRWLGAPGIELVPQPEGDLGARIVRAFERGFELGERVCAIGTDSPDLDRARVETAFDSLERSGGPAAVLGPATDGGYYLVGLRRPEPRLFTEIPWSTGAVLPATLARAGELGIVVELLPPLGDVDRPEDVPEELKPR